MRIFLIIIACIGLVLVLLAAGPASVTTQDFIRNPAGFGHQPGGYFLLGYVFFWAWYPAALGVLLALVGGLIARPRFLWIPAVAIGLVHILSFTGLYIYYFRAAGLEGHPILRTLYAMAPGLLCVIEGLVLRTIGRRASA